MWRREDEDLLERLEDEEALEGLFGHHVGRQNVEAFADRRADRAQPQRVSPSPRAAGLVACVRSLPGGEAAVQAALHGDVATLARFIEAAPMRERPPVFLHHVALYYAKVASFLEVAAPDAAANAWMRSIAAWLALDEERAYLTSLEQSVLGPRVKENRVEVERAPLDVLVDLGKRAEMTSRDLAPAGRAAILALTWVGEAGRIAGVAEDVTRRAERAAERQRNAALDAALAVVGEALDEANLRGELGAQGRTLLSRALEVWRWSGHDEAVEQFVVDRLGTIGWELYRARAWDALRTTFDPFRPLIEHFAARIERDPSKIAYAGPCAQMFVFLTDVEQTPARKYELAERAVHICPTHRNGRLNLASILCDQATSAMRNLTLFVRKDDIDRIEALLARAEALYPTSSELPDAKAMLERLKRRRLPL